MKRKPIRLLIAVAAIAVVGLGVVALAGSGDSPAAAVDMHHGKVKFARGQEQQILNAVATTNASTANDQLVAEGRKVFRDPSLFMDGESCQTCHAEGAASPDLGTMTHDTQATGEGLAGMTDFNGPRDVPALWGLAKTAPYFWDGSIGTLNAAILRPVKGHMKRFVSGDCANSNTDECNTAAATLVAQLVAYVKTLDPPATAFDEGKLSASALRGEKLFQGKGGCIECHGGPLFTDNLTHDTAVPQVTFKSPYRAADAPAVTSNDTGGPPPPPEAAAPAPRRPPAATPRPPRAPRSSTPRSCATSRTRRRTCTTARSRPSRRSSASTTAGICRAILRLATPSRSRWRTTRPRGSESNLGPLNLTDAEIRHLVAYLESL